MISLLIIFFLVSIVFSFLCSTWEAVLLSITPSYVHVQHQEGTALGQHLSDFKENIDKPLAAILTLNTIAHTVGAIGVGAQATEIWGDTHPLVTSVAVPILMTLAVLILSEIIPKTIGANNWRKLAPFTVNSLLFIMKILAPLIWLTQWITRFLNKNKDESVLSRSDFMVMADVGAQEGVFQKEETNIIKNLMRFDNIPVKSIMTPRTVVKAAPDNMTLQAFYDKHTKLPFSRIPLYHEDSKDRVVGYFLKDSLLEGLLKGQGEQPLSDLCREIVMVGEDYSITALHNRLLEEHEHIALVVDDFGGTAGIATMEDVIETLLGLEIVDETDGDADMQALARTNWEKRARALGLLDEAELDEAEEAAESNTTSPSAPAAS